MDLGRKIASTRGLNKFLVDVAPNHKRVRFDDPPLHSNGSSNRRTCNSGVWDGPGTRLRCLPVVFHAVFSSFPSLPLSSGVGTGFRLRLLPYGDANNNVYGALDIGFFRFFPGFSPRIYSCFFSLHPFVRHTYSPFLPHFFQPYV